MSAAYHPSGFGQPASLRRRGLSLFLAVLTTALLLVLLFTMAPSVDRTRPDRAPITVTLLPDTVVADNDATRPETKRPRATAAAKQPRRPDTPTSAPTPAQATAPEVPPPLNMILLSRETYAASDIARLPAGGADGSADRGADRAGDSQLAGGSGPGGEKLYKAEWYRRPSHADLAGYGYSKGPGVGWGEIACRTAPDYRVEDCFEYGQSAGSGLARVVRDAASRFRVRPPRIGGRPLIGTWVLIHIDYSEAEPG